MLFDRTFDFSTETAKPLEVSATLRAEVEQFLYREARLLDTRKLQDWLDLFTPDGMYWVPHALEQTSPHDHISLFWEDSMLREVRMRRLSNPRNWSQQPPTRTARIVGNVMIDGLDEGGRLIVHSILNVTEWRLNQRHLAGLATHKLEAQEGGGWKIFLKRVDLVNCGDAFANLEMFV
jgi:ethylbenzene dioxygenase subunit beta